jgi:RNA polymerase sigma-70 factor (ECF subfamily)
MYLIQTVGDQTLLIRLREGDRDAFAKIYDVYFAPLYQHAYNRLRDTEAAKDVVQELFTVLWEKRELLDLKTNLSNYLFTSVRNRVLNALAHQQVVSEYMLSFSNNLDMAYASTDHRVRERQLMDVIEAEIKQLPPKMREVFELSRKDHLTYKRIAEQLNITEQSVRSHVKNALRILKVRLGVFICLYYILTNL